MSRENTTRRSMIKTIAAASAIPFGTGIVSAKTGSRDDLRSKFESLIEQHGEPTVEGTVVRDGQKVLYQDGEQFGTPPNPIKGRCTGVLHQFEDGTTVEYWSELGSDNHGFGQNLTMFLDGKRYKAAFRKPEQKEIKEQIKETPNKLSRANISSTGSPDYTIEYGTETAFYFASLDDNDTDVGLGGVASADTDLDEKKGYAEAKVAAGGQVHAIAEVWTTLGLEGNNDGTVKATVEGTWSGSMVATPGTGANGEVYAFIRESGGDNEKESQILHHSAPIYGDYWDKRSSYSNWDDGDNTVTKSLDSDGVYEVGVRLKCTATALGTTGPLPGSVASDFYSKNPADPTVDPMFASFENLKIDWPNM